MAPCKPWKSCLHSYCKDVDNMKCEENNAKIKSISSAIQEREIHFIEFVEELGSILTSSDISQRQCGMKLLAQVLHTLPQDFLTSKEVESVASFLCCRLQDHHTIVPEALQGLLALSCFSNLPVGYARMLIKALFKDVHVPSQLQNERYAVYKMISQLLHSRLQELKSMGSDFVFGFIQVLDGERDPRCLLLAFHIVPFLTRHFELGPLVEDLFEVIACYFPVDFNPGPADNFGIARRDLSEALLKSLISTPKFAEFCIPLVLEKLDSDVVTARLDSFHVLTQSCYTFGVNDLQPFLPAIWTSIRREVFMGKDKKSEEEALTAFTNVLLLLSSIQPEPGNSSLLEEYITGILQECEHHLCQPELMLMSPSAKILHAAATASPSTSLQVLSSVLPLLLQQFTVQIQIGQRKIILELLTKFLNSTKIMNFNKEDHSPLQKYRDSLLALFLSVIVSDSDQLKILGLTALIEVLNIPYLMKDNHCELLGQHALQMILSENDENIRAKCRELLSKLSIHYPQVIKTYIMPILKNELAGADLADEQRFVKTLDAVISACSELTVMMETMQTLMTLLKHQLFDHLTEKNVFVTAKGILSLIAIHLANISPPVGFMILNIMQPLMELCFKIAVSKNNSLSEQNFITFETISQVIQSIVQASDSSSVLPLMTKQIQILLFGNINVSYDTEDEKAFLFETLSPLSQALVLLILKSVLAGIQHDAEIPHYVELIEWLLKVTVESKCHLTSQTAAQCIAILINKMEDSIELQAVVNTCYNQLIHQNENSANSINQENTLLAWIWITKSLVLRGHPQMLKFIMKLVSWLRREELRRNAAEGFSIIIQDCPEILSYSGHARIKLLYQQRFFTETCPLLHKEYNQASESQKPFYLIALCMQFKHIPKTVLLSQLPSLLPLLLYSLNHNQHELQLSVLECFRDLLVNNPQLLEEYVHTIVPKFLKLAQYQYSMKIRMHSLSCLLHLTSLHDHLLLPLRQDVIKELLSCLDDKKRLVRNAAVEARCHWFMVGQPGS